MQVNTLSRSGFLAYNGPLVDEQGLNHNIQSNESSKISSLKQPPIFSKDGKFIAFMRNAGTGIEIHECSSSGRTPVCELTCPEVQSVEFSPRGTYAISWSRPTTKSDSDDSSTSGGNLQIWRVLDGNLVLSFFQKVSKRDVIQWTEDERLMFHLVTNEVQIFAGDDLARGIIAKVHHKGLTIFKASPTSSPAHIAVFTPEASGKPARVCLYKYDIGKCEVSGPGNSRTMFAATDATCLWNSTGDTVLVHTHTDVDRSNTSYYGATGLAILTTDGVVSALVSQSKEGSVYEVKWAPDGMRFVICAGNMPCQTTMYSSRGDPVYEFGAAHRNTISWSPHGRFLCIAGFGNLAGEMDFYDTVKLKKIGSNAAHCTVAHSWSPDSRYFLTAVLAPRMNVDNGFRIFKYNGTGPVIHHQQEDPLYHTAWHPRDSQLFPNRGQSPKRNDGAVETSASTAVNTPSVAKPAPAPYRPPGSTGSLSDLLRREAAPVGKIKPAGEAVAQKKPVVQPAPVRRIPGMAPPSTAPPVAVQGNGKKAATPVDKEKKTPVAKPPAAPVPQPPAVEPVETNPAARLKNLRKRIKQIKEIRSKLTEEPGFKPNVDQLSKLASETALLAEVAELEAIVK